MTSSFSPSRSLKTAVLFLVFNRPDTTAQVFETIRQAKPARLYVAADGARNERDGELERVAMVREIATIVDWPCEVKTLFQDKNLGCKNAVSSAISWFFEHEEQGIILEDDCLPSADFFDFCENNLEKYRSDTRIMMIAGVNYLPSKNLRVPFFFSEHFTIWGWATWRRAWQLYDLEMSSWNYELNNKYLRNKFKHDYVYRHFRSTFDLIAGGMDTWDIQWVFTCITNHGLCLTPAVNLVSNIGIEGVHATGRTDSHFMQVCDLKTSQYKHFFPSVRVNYEYDIALHEAKNRKALRTASIVRLLKGLRLYKLAKVVRRTCISLKA